MDDVLRFPQLASQVANGHLLLLQGGEILLWIGGSEPMAVPTGVVTSGGHPYGERRQEMTRFP